MILSHLFFLAAGFFLLRKGADFLIDGSIDLAKRYHVSDWVVGVTVVAFGGSLPELVVNFYAASIGSTDIAVSNILGSVTANIFLVLGVASLIYTLAVQPKTLWVFVPLGFLSLGLAGLLAFLPRSGGEGTWVLSRLDGIIMFIGFLAFMVYALLGSKREGQPVPHHMLHRAPKLAFLILVGLAGLLLGSHWVIQAAIALTQILGVSESFIGFTVVAIGTSLPELAASAAAAYKKNAEIAVANVVGSNVFNVLFVLAISSVIRPLPFAGDNLLNFVIAIAACFLLFFCLVVRRAPALGRIHGISFLGVYVLYLVYLVVAQRG